MIVTEELVAQIVEKVLAQLEAIDNKPNHKNLIISNSNELNADEVSYLNYECNTKYNSIVIDKLSLEECSRIIFKIRHKDKINFIIDNYEKLKMNVLEIEGSDIELSNIYRKILESKGFVFEKQISINEEVMTFNKKVLNERDLMDMKISESCQLTLLKRTIITPLAKDYLRKNKIIVVRED